MGGDRDMSVFFTRQGLDPPHQLGPAQAPVERRIGANASDRGFVHEGLFRRRVCVKLTVRKK